jgi:hypothetical protein
MTLLQVTLYHIISTMTLNNIIAFGDIVAFLFFGCLTDVVARDVV